MDTEEHLDQPQALSAREIEVVRLVVEGSTNEEIALRLSVSPRTVQAHLARIAKKLGVRTRTQVAVTALRIGLVLLHPSAEATESPQMQEDEL